MKVAAAKRPGLAETFPEDDLVQYSAIRLGLGGGRDKVQSCSWNGARKGLQKYLAAAKRPGLGGITGPGNQ